MKKIIISLLLLLLFSISSTAFAAYKEYKGRCKWTFDTLTFGNYIDVDDCYFTTHNFHNYKYSHTSGEEVNFTLDERLNFDDGSGCSWARVNQESGSYSPYALSQSIHAKYHIGIINDYYTGSYMYTEGSYYSY
jgi:hypothetical protein